MRVVKHIVAVSDNSSRSLQTSNCSCPSRKFPISRFPQFSMNISILCVSCQSKTSANFHFRWGHECGDRPWSDSKCINPFPAELIWKLMKLNVPIQEHCLEKRLNSGATCDTSFYMHWFSALYIYTHTYIGLI